MADIEHLEAALSPVVTDHGMELVDLEFRAERSGWVLRLFVDQQGGVTVDDCARVSRDCSVVLDAKDLIEQSYRLEVSSPGIERRLRKREHFAQQVGQQVRIVLRAPLEGRRRVIGTLTEVSEDAVTVTVRDGETLAVPFDMIKKANLKVF